MTPSKTTLLDVAEDLGLRAREPFQIRLDVNDLVAQLRHERNTARRSAEALRLSLRAALEALGEAQEEAELAEDIITATLTQLPCPETRP